jgi:hypothetical protein
MQKVSINPSGLLHVRLGSSKDAQSCFARFHGGTVKVLDLHV